VGAKNEEIHNIIYKTTLW